MLSKNRIIGVALWAFVFALCIALLLIIPGHYTGSIYVTLIFDCIAFLTLLILWVKFLWKGNASSVFYNTPAMIISVVYAVIQFVISIVTGLKADVISTKTALIINLVVMAISLILIISMISVKDYSRRIDSRQKDHHTVL